MTTPPVSAEEFRVHLNMSSGDASTNATEMALMLEAATDLVEHGTNDIPGVGPMVTRSVTETLESYGGSRLFPTRQPVVTLTTVTDPNGTVVTGPTLYAGEIVWRYGWFACGFWTVAYTAGRGVAADVPAALKLATLIVGKHLWETQRNASSISSLGRFGAPTPEPMVIVPSGFAMPNRAVQLMAGYGKEAASL